MNNYIVICRLISRIIETTVRYFDSELTLLCIFPQCSDTEDSMTTDYNLLASMLNKCLEISKPIIYMAHYKCECYAQVPVYEKGSFKGIYVVGPVRCTRPSVNRSETRQMTYSAFTAVVSLIYYFVTGNELDESKIVLSGAAKDIKWETRKYFNESLKSSRELNHYHGTYKYEKFLMGCIKKGDLKNLKLYSQSPYTGNIGTMVPNPRNDLRQAKNVLIAFITMATRAAIEGGLNIEIAYTLSDIYIQQAENLSSAADIYNLSEKALIEFTTRVNQCQMKPFSKPVQQCIDFIQDHVYEKIKVQSVAGKTGYNCNYVARLFKKETGMSVVSYINKQKIEEAKGLLQFSKYSASEVSAILSFSSQSYFISMFKKFTGKTPKEFRFQNGKNLHA